MGFHPKDVPISKTYDLKDEKEAMSAVEDMVKIGFKGKKEGFRILMPKESKIAKRIGYSITTGIATGLRQKNEGRYVKYWTYHHDDEHYAIVLTHRDNVEGLEF